MSMQPSLEVFAGGERIFASDGKWLHPLFELEQLLTANGRPEGEIEVRDKVVGKAAAMIMAYLGVDRIHGGMVSSLAEEFLAARDIPLTYDELVPRILCRTEELLENVDDPEEGYRIVKQRAEAARP
jgi:zinc transport system ATP-binding protein